MLQKANISVNWIFYLYIFFFSTYNLQGSLYPNGSIISQISLIFICLLGVCGIYHEFLKSKSPIFTKTIFTFLSILTTTYILSPKIVIGHTHEAIGVVNTFDQFKKETAFCLQLFIGILIARKSEISHIAFLLTTILLIIISIINFYHVATTLILERGNTANTINVAYQFVVILPFLALTLPKYKIWLLMCFGFILFFVIFGAKRGALVCLVAAILYSIHWYNKYLHLKRRQRIIGVFIIIALGIFAFNQFISNEYLQQRITKSGTGTREIAYSILFNHWLYDDCAFSILFGNGTAQTINIWGNYGHNDWLELLIDNGLLGALLYIIIFLSGFYFIKKRMTNKYYKLASTLCIIIWLLKSFFSMGYTDFYSGILLVVLGYCVKRTIIEKTNASIL